MTLEEEATSAVHAAALRLAGELWCMGELGEAFRCGDDLSGMCGPAADALAVLLREKGLPAELCWGGEHAWVLSGELVCDPTSLQFAGDGRPWHVTPRDSAGPRYEAEGTSVRGVLGLPWHDPEDESTWYPHIEKAPLLVGWLVEDARPRMG